jgi:hypothetical protein
MLGSGREREMPLDEGGPGYEWYVVEVDYLSSINIPAWRRAVGCSLPSAGG